MLGQEGYIGCKTGVTDAAGPCLSAVWEQDETALVFILMCSQSMDARWKEVPRLLEWALAKKKIIEEKRSESQGRMRPQIRRAESERLDRNI